MIKGTDGEKRTPKQLAKETAITALKNAVVPAQCTSEMTEKEAKLVDEQLEKVQARLLKILGDAQE